MPHARIAGRTVKQFWDHNASQPTDPNVAPVVADKAKQAPAGAVIIRSVKHKMHYDRKVFTVKAGEKVKIWFENPDYLPHNLIIGHPNSAEVIATAAEKLGQKGFDVHFVPKSDLIIAATKLLQHRDAQLLEFTAPAKPGDYDYLCTFPGHWQLMRGVMKVEK